MCVCVCLIVATTLQFVMHTIKPLSVSNLRVGRIPLWWYLRLQWVENYTTLSTSWKYFITICTHQFTEITDIRQLVQTHNQLWSKAGHLTSWHVRNEPRTWVQLISPLNKLIVHTLMTTLKQLTWYSTLFFVPEGEQNKTIESLFPLTRVCSYELFYSAEKG